MNLTLVAIENRRTTWVALIVIILAGVWAYFNSPRDYDPGFVVRTAQVITFFPGASAERVESLITDKLEKVIQEIPEMDNVVSESRMGVSIIQVNIQERYSDLRPIWDNVRRKIDAGAKSLPDGVEGPFVNDEFGDVFGIVLTLTGDGFSFSEMKSVADKIRDTLLRIPLTSKVELYGVQAERVFIDFDAVRLAELGLTPFHLMQQLSGRNVVVPGGAINVGQERIVLEPSGNYEHVDEIKRTLIQVPGKSSLIYLGDVTRVHRGYVEPAQSKVHSTGESALAIAVSMSKGGDITALGETVQAATRRLIAQYPIGLEVQTVNFSPYEVETKVQDFMGNLLQSIVVVAGVMLLSLGLRTGLVVAVLIPSSMIMALLVMSVFQIGLDQISLAALIIALGMLVDNGIVMTESIIVQMESGKTALQAAVDSANELRIPLLTSSLTTAAAFLPIYLAESSTGEYTAPLFKVVTITLLCSWLLSLTIIPLLCVHFLKVKPMWIQGRVKHFVLSYLPIGAKSRVKSGVKRMFSWDASVSYARWLNVLLRHQLVTLLVAILLLLASLFALRWVPTIFFPPSDRTYFKMEMTLPSGVSLKTTEKTVEAVEKFLREKMLINAERTQGVKHWVAYVGNGGPRFLLTHTPKPTSPNYALLVIDTTSLDVIDEMMAQLSSFVWNSLPDVSIKLKRFENGAPIENPIEIRLSGDDPDILLNLSSLVKQKLQTMDGLNEVIDDWGLRSKKMVLQIDQDEAKRLGISNKDIALSMQTNLSGLALSQFREGNNIIPIVMRSEAAEHLAVNQLDSLIVHSQLTGRSFALRQVANPVLVWGAAKIWRRNLEKTVTVGAQVVGNTNAIAIFQALRPWLEEQQRHWPPGYHYAFGGEMETSEKANASIMEKLPIAALFIVLVLVAQFNSVRQPLIILTTIPFGIAGVIWGLLLFHSYFGFMTLLGVISLSGIVINNAIVLLERITLEKEVNGVPVQEAIVLAARRRLRPILLTTVTTVCGLMPLYWGGGLMWEPMAIAIIVGLLFSTLLTLGLVPVLYALLFGVRFQRVCRESR